MTPEFKPFPKMARLSRECCVTEKLDGTNASILIASSEGRPVPHAVHEWQDPEEAHSTVMLVGSRTRWITPQDDNFGFARWVRENSDDLVNLGHGHHFGEWWGQGIQRGYDLKEKRFSLFNAIRWAPHGTEPAQITSQDPRVVKFQDVAPACCHVVPVLYQGLFNTLAIICALESLKEQGSAAAPGYDKPEGIVAYHIAGNVGFKQTIKKDSEPKSIFSLI